MIKRGDLETFAAASSSPTSRAPFPLKQVQAHRRELSALVGGRAGSKVAARAPNGAHLHEAERLAATSGEAGMGTEQSLPPMFFSAGEHEARIIFRGDVFFCCHVNMPQSL